MLEVTEQRPMNNGYLNLHCIAEIRTYWVETKPFEIDNPQHLYQIA